MRAHIGGCVVALLFFLKPCALFRSLVLRGSNYDVGMDVDVRDQLGRVWRLELSAVVFLRSRRMVEAKSQGVVAMLQAF